MLAQNNSYLLIFEQNHSHQLAINRSYYTIDPWSLESLLVNWYELNLRNSKNRKIASYDKSINNKRYSIHTNDKEGFKGLRHNGRMAIGQAATANEIAEIASEFGYEFSGDELKAISKENIPGLKIKKQDTSPSYSFGESGIDPNEKNYKSGN